MTVNALPRGTRRPLALAVAAALGAAALTLPTPADAATRGPARIPVGHALGGVAPTAARIAPRAATGRLARSLPESVDLTGNTMPAGNQGNVGSCAAWATGYSLMGWYARSGAHFGAPFAPMYLYSQTHGAGGDVGSTIGGNLTVLRDQGVAELAAYPRGNFNWTVKPNAAEKANAALHKQVGWHPVFYRQNQGEAGMTAIKTELAAGRPVVLGIPVYHGFDVLNPADSVMTLGKATGALRGWHAVTAFGYDSTGVTIENSWGTYWGRNGFATLAWDFVGSLVGEADAADGLVVPTAPTVTRLSAPRVSTLGGTPVLLTGTGLATLDATDADAVTLVNGEHTLPVTVTSRTVSTLTLSSPALDEGLPLTGWRVRVTTPSGSSADVPADDVSFVTPVVGTLSATLVPAPGASLVLTGTGFGSSAREFAAQGVTATVADRATPVTWLSATTLRITVPAGTPGRTAAVVVRRLGVAAPATTVEYGATVSRAAFTVSLDATRTGTLVGKGLLDSTDWTLTGPDGTVVELPAAASRTALLAGTAGVLVANDTAATVRLPARPGRGGLWTVSFTPSTTRYPGAEFVATGAAGVGVTYPS